MSVVKPDKSALLDLIRFTPARVIISFSLHNQKFGTEENLRGYKYRIIREILVDFQRMLFEHRYSRYQEIIRM